MGVFCKISLFESKILVKSVIRMYLDLNKQGEDVWYDVIFLKSDPEFEIISSINKKVITSKIFHYAYKIDIVIN